MTDELRLTHHVPPFEPVHHAQFLPTFPCAHAQVADIEAAEKEKMKEKCAKIISQGISCFINRQLIYNFPEEIFADAGIMAIGEICFSSAFCCACRLPHFA